MHQAYCDECGSYLATLDEIRERLCVLCQFARDWLAFLNEQSRVPAYLLEPARYGEGANAVVARKQPRQAAKGR